MKYTSLKDKELQTYGTGETSEGTTNNDKEKLIDEKKEEGESSATDVPPPAGFFDLFRYATCLDRIFIIIGSVFAVCQGLGWPAIFLIFGGMTDSFTAPAIQENATHINSYNATRAYLEKFQEDMNKFTLLYVYIACAIFVACYFQISFWGMVGERVVHRMRQRFFQSIMRQDMGWFDKHQSGELTTRLADDFNKVKDGVGDKFSLVLQSLATFIGGFVIGFVISWRLTLVMLAMTPPLALCGALMSKAIAGYASKEQEKYADAGSVAEEVLSCIRTVVSFRGQKKEVERYNSKLKETLSLGNKKGLVTAISFGLNMLIIHATYCLAYWYGSTLVVSGILSSGQVFTVFLCVILGAVTLGNVGTNFAAVAVAKGSAGAVLHIIDREPAIDSSSEGGDRLEYIKGNVEFIDVNFRYPTRPDVLVLDKLNLDITPGQTVALVGSSGCGKSTTVGLIQRFYDPVDGQVLIDGNDIKSLNIKWLREQIGVVSQEPVLFDCSIAENIRYGRLDVTQAEIEIATRAANAHAFITKLPDGYETVVGERGAQMSGGQKQRIAIARALVRDPKILLLDEATSALDSESEKVVQAALEKASEGRTTIVVAHRLSTIQNADVIYVFKDGSVKEQGSHSTLMTVEGGIYRELVNMQKLAAEEDKKAMELDVIYDEPGTPPADDQLQPPLKRRRSTTRTSFGDFDRKETEEEHVADDVAFRQIFSLNKPEVGYILGGCLASVVVGASMPVFAVFFSELVRVFGEPLDQLKKDAVFWSLMFLVLGVAVGLGNFFMQFLLGVSGEKLTNRLRCKTFESMLRQDIAWFDKSSNSTGALTSRLATDASMVKQATGIRIGTVVQSVSGIVTGLAIALVFGWKLALAILAATPLCALSGAIQNKVQHGGQKKDNELLAQAGKVASEAIENVRTVQSLTREEEFYNSYAAMLLTPFKEAIKTCHIYGLSFAFSQAIIFFLYAGAFRFGAYLVYTGDMTPPNVFRVFFAIAFAGIAMGQAASLLPDYSKAKLSAAHVMKIISTVPRIDSYAETGRKPDIVSGEVEFRDVKFAYPNRPDMLILKGLNLTIKPGQTVALVGSSGCGKSTTVSLIQRFYEPNRGSVFLDGEDLKNLNVTWLRSQVGVVSQEPVLFDCSIRENIAYGVDHIISDYDIIEAARTANIHDFIEDLPAGYDTQVGEKGTQLSGGQKQRIAIARALVCNPKILLLDEATSALDTESEKIVQVALDKARAGRTCVIIAHRLSTIQNADVIAVVETGVIVEMGTHQELLAKKGSYYNLCSAQQLA